MHQNTWKIFSSPKDNGFTLLELLVVIFMVGVLAAIAAPSWFGFVRQQRLNKANELVFAALQEAQREAKREKRNYSVSFRVNNNIPQMSIYSAAATPDWKNLTQELESDSRDIIVGTNLNTTANTVVSPNAVAFNNLNTIRTVTFDYMGALAGSNPSTGIMIVVAIPQSTNSTTASSTRRCVVIETLIGGMRTARDNSCS